MAEATTTRPARTRSRAAATTAAKPAAAAKTPAKAAPAKAAPAAKTEVTRFTVELEHVGPTKTYEKFVVPESYKGTVVGSIYAPLGTERVGIVVIQPEDAEDVPAAE
jgi:hypothetical protein